MKFFFASFNRASDEAILGIKDLLDDNEMLAYSPDLADYIVAVGDRSETLEFVLPYFKQNKPIIHLWAGEHSGFDGTHDDAYRTALTLMSEVQLCATPEARYRTYAICRAVDKTPKAFIVGTPYLDDMTTSDRAVPDEPYYLVLYNPNTKSEAMTKADIEDIQALVKNHKYIWIEPNGDMFSDLVPYNCKNLPRRDYLGLLKNCKAFISNSSSVYTEAAFFHKKVIMIGERNKYRETGESEDALLTGCKDNVLGVLSSL